MMPTEMSDSANANAQQDQAAVDAVRGGDAERYRELVERHERRVYAVAWSRLGDAALAEEATQEAFIRAYRRLWLLGDGAKFAGWVNTIARRMATNCGLRHRRELNKRERWALEYPAGATAEESPDQSAPLCTPETLRQTLAELPDAHRECLVLFYLEGKSGAEAAAALGLSPTTLRVRLHRARAALRERLEEKLADSLAQLRPARTLVPAVMAGVLASSSAKAATASGASAAVAGALAKLGFTKWLLPFAAFFSFVFFLPMLLVSWMLARMELRNFRDQQGFRARLFRAEVKRRLLVVFVGMLAAGVVIPALLAGLSIIPANSLHGLGMRPMLLCVGVFSLVFLPFLAWQLVINRNPYFVAHACGSLATGVVFLLVGLSWLPGPAVMVVFLGQYLLTLSFFGQRPNRMDYNLFLRAVEGLLKTSPEQLPAGPSPVRASQGEQLAFARFLGSRWLVSHHRWVGEGLQLRLPMTGSSPWWNWTDWMFNWSWKHRSHIQLAPDGKASAHLCEADQKALSRLHRAALSNAELEKQVADALAVAWRTYRQSNLHAAELALGQQSDLEVFHVAPAKGGVAKARWVLAGLLAVTLATFSGLRVPGCRERLEGMKPVNVSEAQVRAFLGRITTNQNPIQNHQQRSYLGDPTVALSFCLVLPSTNLFTPEALLAVQQEVFRAAGFDPQGESSSKLAAFENFWLLHKSMCAGWLDWQVIGLDPQAAAEFFHQRAPAWQFRLSRQQAWSWVKSQRFTAERISDFTLNQLRWLSAIHCLDLVGREKLILQLASVQVLSASRSADQPPLHDWRDVRGLFFTPCWPALQDTYFSLAALELLGGLDKIDREACIQGILRRHQGKGYFTSPDSGGFNEYHIDGSARDTFAAYESLRILGGLDRVKDLERWRFRVPSSRTSKPAANGIRTLTWDEVEAWVCQQRWEQILRERKAHPQTPFGSLLETQGLSNH